MEHTITSHIRGGGSGSEAWVAKITGTGGKFGLERQFVRKIKNTSKSGRSGTISFVLDQPGIYEFRGVQHEAGQAGIGDLADGFIELTEAGDVHPLKKSEVIGKFNAQAA